MSISPEEIKKSAWDARLKLSSQEEEILREEAEKILKKALDFLKETEDFEPTFHPLPITSVLREDEEKPSLPVEVALKNAPDADEYCFNVPRIIEE
ncbi:MAG: Asp-tRNA(Asn)/Glu-tRNA(Gln) amidotransferase subunit GatC [Candidatus Syntrophonatronum acetioxidans]|uniref:Aspartyl/glutamyl-tRNA(Asn/Gln) amidotransferase subunit C n=1 Tax=Candidatus Syntrophonatronum acetioxidans TaxID=1795816 RepID=A0A424YAP7_9FIRM|nr:MAG: Asp-tRNA(Asn)/Glu-tRNA(Gln) amidotransferase subunit GatC [Candidatus Syntrophonatronum acetioxidans]